MLCIDIVHMKISRLDNLYESMIDNQTRLAWKCIYIVTYLCEKVGHSNLYNKI